MAPSRGDFLTRGVYTPAQAAYLARLNPRTVNAWLEPTSRLGPAITRELPESDGNIVSFLDFVQMLAVHAIRRRRRVSLQKIRATVQTAEELGVSFPFARQHQVYLLKHSDEIAVRLANGELIQASGPAKRQHVMEPVVEAYLEDLSFDSEGLADAYRPLKSESTSILIAPKRRYGAPIVETCDYTVETLVSAVKSEGSIEAAAEMCEVDRSEVLLALKYEDILSGVAA